MRGQTSHPGLEASASTTADAQGNYFLDFHGFESVSKGVVFTYSAPNFGIKVITIPTLDVFNYRERRLDVVLPYSVPSPLLSFGPITKDAVALNSSIGAVGDSFVLQRAPAGTSDFQTVQGVASGQTTIVDRGLPPEQPNSNESQGKRRFLFAERKKKAHRNQFEEPPLKPS